MTVERFLSFFMAHGINTCVGHRGQDELLKRCDVNNAGNISFNAKS